MFLNWEDYIDPSLIAAFEAKYDVRVREIYFGNDEERNRMLIESDGAGYDLAIIDGEAVSACRANGWLAPLDRQKVETLAHIRPRWQTIYAAAEGVAMPYFWGTIGIAYRADLLPKGIHSWKEFFAPEDKLRKRIATVGSAPELISLALKAGGHSANSTDPAALAEAEATLLRQQPFVLTYADIDLGENSALLSGDVVASMMYNGDAMTLADRNPDIRFVVPEEGGQLWVDYLVVMASSSNRDLAYAFVNFLNEPANAAQNAQYLRYPTPNAAAEALLPAPFRNNPAIFPPDDVLAKSEVNQPLPARIARQRAMIYARLVD